MQSVGWRVFSALVLAMATANAAPPADILAVKPDLSVTLQTGGASQERWLEGVGGTVAGAINPTLTMRQGAVVRIELVNGDEDLHQLVIPALDVRSTPLEHAGERTTVVLRATRRGRFDYFCSTPGHREAGAAGVLMVGEPATASRDVAGKSTLSQSPEVRSGT